MSYKIRRNITGPLKGEYYLNVALLHLPRPNLRDKPLYDCDGEIIPIIHITTDGGIDKYE